MAVRSAFAGFHPRAQVVIVVLCRLTMVSLGAAQAPPEAGPPQNNNAAANSTTPHNTNPPKPTLRTVITVTGPPAPASLAPHSVRAPRDQQIRHAHALTSRCMILTM